MIHLPIEKYTVKIPGHKEVTTLTFLKDCILNPPEKGFSYDDLKTRERIESIIDKTQEDKKAIVVKFETNDGNNVKEIVKSMLWTLYHKDIIHFVDSIEEMKEEK